MYRTYRVEQTGQDVGHVAAQEAIFPQQLLLLLRDLGQRVALLDVSQQRELGAAGGGLWRGRGLLLAEVSTKFSKLTTILCLHLYLLGVEPGEEHGVLLDLAVVGEDDGVGPGLELDRQVG